MVGQLTGDSGQLTAEEGVQKQGHTFRLPPGLIGKDRMTLQQQNQLGAQMGRDRRHRSLAGLPWTEVVQEQAAANACLEKELTLADEVNERLQLQVNLLTHDLEHARARCAELEKLKAVGNDAAKDWRGRFRRAARVVTMMGRKDNHWHDVAVAEQAALTAALAEKSRLEQALVETTATMNRYHGDWQNAVGQVQDLQAQQAQWQVHHGELTMALRDVSDELAAARKQIENGMAGEKENAAPLPAPGQAGSLSHVGGVTARCIDLKLTADVETSFLLLSDGIFTALLSDGDEVTTHKHPASHRPLIQALLGDSVETIETLRGRVAQVSKSLDEEKAGRLRAETLIDELEGRLASERKAAELALERQKVRLESEALATRDNFLAQLTGVQSMLTEAERRARHGELLASALRFDLSDEEFARVSLECWGLMKPGSIHHEEHEGHEGGEKEEGEEISTTDGTDSTDGVVVEGSAA